MRARVWRSARLIHRLLPCSHLILAEMGSMTKRLVHFRRRHHGSSPDQTGSAYHMCSWRRFGRATRPSMSGIDAPALASLPVQDHCLLQFALSKA